MPVINENEMVCRYCGFKDKNSGEIPIIEKRQKTTCKLCMKEFYFEKTINVIYTTYSLEETKKKSRC